ncbi:MAG: GNAT family N-acetyltransferase [Caldimonas sp.]
MHADAEPEITVRQAVSADLEPLADLFDRYRQFQGQPADRAAARRFLKARFDHGESILFIALEEATALGFAQLYPSFSSVALSRVFILNDLFVAEDGRRRQVASRLLAELEAYAWSFGACRVTLNVGRSNTSAQALYAARGWEQDERHLMVHRYPPPAAGDA